jgi:protein-tyrosine phosphatase
MMFDSILVVCVGNICRSPTGERLLQQAFPSKRIASAGISALVGKSADDTAVAVANEHNLSLEGHLGKQLTKEMCREYSLILVMGKRAYRCSLPISTRGERKNDAFWSLAGPAGNSRSIS